MTEREKVIHQQIARANNERMVAETLSQRYAEDTRLTASARKVLAAKQTDRAQAWADIARVLRTLQTP